MTASLHVIFGLGSGRLATIAHPRDDGWGADRLSDLAGQGVTVLAAALTAPELQRVGLTAPAGLEVVPFPLGEAGLPREEAAQVVLLAGRLAAHVRAGHFVAVQCFGGIGRSTLLVGLTLVLLGIGPGEALRRVTGGQETPVTRDWLHDFALQKA